MEREDVRLKMNKEVITDGFSQIRISTNQLMMKMIDPIKKGAERAKVEVPPIGAYEGVALSTLPKYVSYKAALLKEKALWQNISIVLLLCLIAVMLVNQNQITKLTKMYREKEYIVLPDYIPVSPHTISDDYVREAVSHFISLLGNVNSKSIDKQYMELAENMELSMRRRFEEQSVEWVNYVKSEKITEVFNCSKEEIYSHNNGKYDVTAVCKKETYINHEYIGSVDEVVEMSLKLIPPKRQKRWVLHITDIKRNTKKAFKAKSKL